MDLRRELHRRFECSVSYTANALIPSFTLPVTRLGYNGTAIVQRSIELNKPVIYVALNYRCVTWLHIYCVAQSHSQLPVCTSSAFLAERRSRTRALAIWVSMIVSRRPILLLF